MLYLKPVVVARLITAIVVILVFQFVQVVCFEHISHKSEFIVSLSAPRVFVGRLPAGLQLFVAAGEVVHCLVETSGV